MDNVVDVEILDWAHNLSWFDGICYIFLGLFVYYCYKWINNKFK